MSEPTKPEPEIQKQADNGEVEKVMEAGGGTEEPQTQDSGRKSTKKRKRVRKDRMPYLIIASLTALTVFAANGIWRLVASNREPEPLGNVKPLEMIGEQIEAIKSGESDTIEITKAIITDEELALLRDLENLRILILDAGIITDAGMEPISTLTNLVHLRIRNSLITDEGLKHVLGLEKLRILNLPQANLTPNGMKSLTQLTNLRQLRIGGDGTTDLSRAVAELTNLRALHLIDIPVSDEGLRLIAQLPRLESLYLDNARITGVGWQWLFDTHPELHVHINQRHHDIDPNWHLHDPEQVIDDMESPGQVPPDADEILKRWNEQKQKLAGENSEDGEE